MPQSDASTFIPLLFARVDSQRVAFYIHEVAEVVLRPELQEWPRELEVVDGVFNLEGSWLPVFSIGKLLRLPVSELGNFDPLIISKEAPRIAFRVDELEKVDKVHWDRIKPWETSVEQSLAMAARVEDEEEPAWLISISQLLTTQEQELAVFISDSTEQRERDSALELERLRQEVSSS